MITTPLRRSLTLLVALATIASLTALPALAATPSATASLAAADRLLLAGQSNDFGLTVTNTEPAGTLGIGAGQDIDFIQVIVPSWHTDLATAFTPPSGWDGQVFDDDNVIVLSGGSLGPSESLDVAFTGTVTNQLSTDDFGNLRVSVSSDDGRTLGTASPAENGALRSDIDILEVEQVAVTAPEPDGFVVGATDGTVTNGQNNVSVAITVRNRSAIATKTVTPELVKNSGNADFSAPACSATEVDPDTSHTCTVTDVSFSGSNQSLVIDGNATATDADRFGVTDPANRANVAVQQAVALAKADDISPTHVSTGTKPFVVRLDKTGVPAAELDLTLTTTNGSTAGPSDTETDQVFASGTQNGQELVFELTFEELVHPAGTYDASLTGSGVDDNGATISGISIDLGEIVFDPDLPIIADLTLTAPAPHVEGEENAATDGEALTFSGKIYETYDSTTETGTACAECPVTVTLNDGLGTTYPSKMVTSDSNGAFSGEFAEDYPDLVHSLANVKAAGTDLAGNPSEQALSNFALIDTLPPAVKATDGVTWDPARVTAYTGGVGDLEDKRTIDVVFDEGIAAGALGTSPAHWTVSDNTVVAAEIQRYDTEPDGEKTDYAWRVRLTLNDELHGNATPVVTYDPSGDPATRVFDRVDLNLIEGVVDTIDNIAPILPQIIQVDGLSQYTDGNFHTNLGSYASDTDDTLTPATEMTITVDEVESGSTVIVEQVKADGSITELARETNESTEDVGTVTLFVDTAKLPTVAEGSVAQVDIRVYAVDSGPKRSQIAAYTLVLDRDAPEASGASVDTTANTVTVTASEHLRLGRDFASDWLVLVTERGRSETLPVDAVSIGDTPAARVLQVDSDAYPLSSYDSVDQAKYRFLGSGSERYTDPAGNRLSDGTLFSTP